MSESYDGVKKLSHQFGPSSSESWKLADSIESLRILQGRFFEQMEEVAKVKKVLRDKELAAELLARDAREMKERLDLTPANEEKT